MGIDALESVLDLEPETPYKLEPTPPTTPRGENPTTPRAGVEKKKQKAKSKHTIAETVKTKVTESRNDNIFDMMGLQSVDDLLLGDLSNDEGHDVSDEIDEVNEGVSESDTEIQTEIGDISMGKTKKLKYVNWNIVLGTIIIHVYIII